MTEPRRFRPERRLDGNPTSAPTFVLEEKLADNADGCVAVCAAEYGNLGTSPRGLDDGTASFSDVGHYLPWRGNNSAGEPLRRPIKWMITKRKGVRKRGLQGVTEDSERLRTAMSAASVARAEVSMAGL